jgi:hypothetical protein
METEETLRILDTLDSINKAGYDGIGGLLRAMLASKNRRVLRRVSCLVDADLDTIIEALVEHPRYSERRHTGRIPVAPPVIVDFVSRSVGYVDVTMKLSVHVNHA